MLKGRRNQPADKLAEKLKSKSPNKQGSRAGKTRTS
jgi:hypothetical protein